jgi:hypothetical protein
MQKRQNIDEIKSQINTILGIYEDTVRDTAMRLDYERRDELMNCIRYTVYRKALRFVIADCQNGVVAFETMKSEIYRIIRGVNSRNIYYHILNKKRDVHTVPLDDNTAPIQHWDDLSDAFDKNEILDEVFENISPACCLVIIEGLGNTVGSPFFEYYQIFKSEYNRVRAKNLCKF